MEYITRPKYYFPGALSDEAAELLKKIYAEGVYFPDWLTMSKSEIATFDELMPGNYVESCAFRGYRVKGTSYVDTVLSRVKAGLSQRNEVAVIRESLVSVGVDAANIKNIHRSPNGFAPRPNRWCITLHKSAGVPATKINAQPGLSGAIINGNVIYVLLGELGKVG